MSIPCIIGVDSVTVVLHGKPTTVKRGTSNFLSLKRAIAAGNWDQIPDLLSVANTVAKMCTGALKIEGGNITFYGKPLHGFVSQTLLNILAEGHTNASPLVKFLERLMQNPSAKSVMELYDFLVSRGLTIDSDGYVLAHKGVGDNYYPVMGNTATIVLQGVVDNGGHILNSVGSTIEVARLSVDDNRENTCSRGLHLGSFNYANNWGARTLVCRFDPKDAVSVPTDCSCQKLRVCKYEILCELERSKAKDFGTVYYGGSSRSAAHLSFNDLKAEIAKIVIDKKIDVNLDSDVMDIPDFLSSKNWNEVDYHAALAAVTKEINDGRVEKKKGVMPLLRKNATELQRRIYDYLCSKRTAGECPSIKEVQSSLSGFRNVSSENIIRIVKSLGFSVSTNSALSKIIVYAP